MSGEEKQEMEGKGEVNLIERKCPEMTDSKHRWTACVISIPLQRRQQGVILRTR